MLEENTSLTFAAVNTLRRIGSGATAAIPQLVVALDHPNAEVVRYSVLALAEMAAVAPEAGAALADCASHGKVSGTRDLCARALDDPYGGKKSIAALEERLSRAEPRVRYDAALSLFRLGRTDDQVIGLLVESLSDQDKYQRFATARALRDVVSRQPQLIAALIARLSDKYGFIRVAAAEALERIGPTAAPALPELQARLTDYDPMVREAAAAAVASVTQSDRR